MQPRNGTGPLEERSLPDLLKLLADEGTTLVQQQVDLARAELSERAGQAKQGLGAVGVSGMAGVFALGALAAGSVLALQRSMPVWAAVAVTAGPSALVAGGFAALAAGRARRAMSPPTETMESLKEDVEWATQRASGQR